MRDAIDALCTKKPSRERGMNHAANALARKTPPASAPSVAPASTAPTSPPAGRNTASTSTAPACCTPASCAARTPTPRSRRIDTAAAEKMPGFQAVHVIVEGRRANCSTPATRSLGLAADTEEHADDASAPSRSSTRCSPYLVKEEDALKDDKKTVAAGRPAEGAQQRPAAGGEGKTDDFDDGLQERRTRSSKANTACRSSATSAWSRTAWSPSGTRTAA